MFRIALCIFFPHPPVVLKKQISCGIFKWLHLISVTFPPSFNMNVTKLSSCHTVFKSSSIVIWQSASSPCCFHLSIIFFSPSLLPTHLSSLAYVPVVARETVLTCRPMFPWAMGPLGASQRASLPATSGAGGMERALVSALKVNEAAARHSAIDS